MQNRVLSEDVSKYKSPSLLMTRFLDIERPSPVPSPATLVVKKGSNIFVRNSGGMPRPESTTAISI